MTRLASTAPAVICQGLGNCCKSLQASSITAPLTGWHFGQVGQDQGMIAKLIDQARHAAGGRVNRVVGRSLEHAVRLAAADADLMPHDTGRLFTRQRA